MQKFLKGVEHGVFVFFILIGLFAMTSQTYALSTIRALGGTIENSGRSKNVEDIEKKDYKCNVLGSSFTVKSVKKSEQNLDLLVPMNVRSSTRNKDGKNQYFLGLYEMTKQTISCIYQGLPPNTTTTTLNRLKLYGTSSGTAKSY